MLTDLQIKRLLDIGICACHRGKVAQGRTIISGILAYKKDFVPALIALALSHVVINEFDLAEKILKDKVLAHNDNDADALGLLVLSYSMSNKTDEAVAICNRLIQTQSSSAELAKSILNPTSY